MTHPVTSEFSYTFWIKTIVFSLLALSLAIAAIVIVSEYWGEDRHDVLFEIIITALLLGVYLHWAITSIIRITASPEGLIIKRMLTGSKTIIAYTDIAHVSNILVRTGRKYTDSGYLKLVIELRSGEETAIMGEDIANYDELKEAIRRYRFHLE